MWKRRFPVAVAVTAWYRGRDRQLWRVVLSIALFDYFFMEPRLHVLRQKLGHPLPYRLY